MPYRSGALVTIDPLGCPDSKIAMPRGSSQARISRMQCRRNFTDTLTYRGVEGRALCYRWKQCAALRYAQVMVTSEYGVSSEMGTEKLTVICFAPEISSALRWKATIVYSKIR